MASLYEFHLECPLPPEGTRYVSGPNVRSTLNIFWSSVYAIVTCTWVIQHLCLPPQPEKRNLKWTARCLLRRLKWMLVTLFAPEFVVGKAFGDYLAANESVKCPHMEKYTGWSKTHAFYANMGGYILREGETQGNIAVAAGSRTITQSSLSAEAVSPPPVRGPPPASPASSTDEVSPAADESLAGRAPYTSPPTPTSTSTSKSEWPSHLELERFESEFSPVKSSYSLPIALNSAQICFLLHSGAIKLLPSISEDEIMDKSKGDAFLKCSALIQILWIFIELIARKARGLACTQLEIAVAAFGLCSSVTYALWFQKPQGVTIPTYITAERSLSDKEKKMVHGLNSHGFFERVFLAVGYHTPSARTPNDMYNDDASLPFRILSLGPEDLGFVLAATAFGAFHCIAWEFEFPTAIESMLWKVASLTSASIMPVFYVLLWCVAKLDTFVIGTDRRRMGLEKHYVVPKITLTYLCYGTYGVSRLYIMAEAFRTLFYLPSDAFVSTWASSIPHVG